MSLGCPDHARYSGRTLGQCDICDYEARTADQAQGAAAVRAALAQAPRPPRPADEQADPTRDLALVRARADRDPWRTR